MEEYDTKWLNTYSLSAVDGQKIENWSLSTAEKHCDLEQGKYQNVPHHKPQGEGCSNQSCGRGHDEVAERH